MNRSKNVEKRVAKLLASNPSLRNNDEALIVEYRKKYDGYNAPEPQHPVTGTRSITRARQKLQAAGFFLPTNPEIIKKRRKQEVEMREYVFEY